MTKTIFDVGMHKGEDADFYLKKGFRVVGVEANPALCAVVEARFEREIASRQLIVVNQAIADQAGEIDFYVYDDQTVWGTADRGWMMRNVKLGASSHVIKVPAIRMSSILAEHGVPYYMKVDIEGFDLLCIQALRDAPEKPRYVSLESHATSFAETRRQLSLLSSLGYRRFKIVSQHDVHKQRCPRPAREGADVDYTFAPGASGLFGAELPGRWMTLPEVFARYAHIYFNVRMIGPHQGLLRDVTNRYAQAVLARVCRGGSGWFDTHATR